MKCPDERKGPCVARVRPLSSLGSLCWPGTRLESAWGQELVWTEALRGPDLDFGIKKEFQEERKSKSDRRMV